MYKFDEFELFPERYELRRAGEGVKVEPRVFDVLVYLIENRDRVVSKDELVERVWSGAFVTDSALKRAVQEARRAVGDDGKSQRFIQTAYSRGYRFLPEVESAIHESASDDLLSAVEASGECVAREGQINTLNRTLTSVLGGHGGVAFVAGEAGTGKTTLARAFAARALRARPELVVANGNCNAQTGVGDPYLPFREMLDQLTGAHQGAPATREQSARLRSVWSRALKALLDVGPDLIGTFVIGHELMAGAADLESDEPSWRSRFEDAVRRKRSPGDLQQSAIFEQYSRVVQAIAAYRPVLLVLDDLQWADTGSIHLLFHLGRRFTSSPVLILGSYRPAEVALGRDGGRHPLEAVVNELQGDYPDWGVSLAQSGDRLFIDAYLDREPNDLGEEFREALYRQTEGHPLFTVELLRAMRDQGMLVKSGKQWSAAPGLDWELLPSRLSAVIVERVERLPESLRRALALASVEGEQFSCEVLAHILKVSDYEMVQLLSNELDKRHRLVGAQHVRRIDDRLSSIYSFRHVLFQKYVYARLDEVERAYLHELVGNTLESLYGTHREDMAARLARHFQRAGAVAKAVEYFQLAGARAVRLAAHEEAIAHFSSGLALVEEVPDGNERARRELSLRLAMAIPLQALKGFSTPELAQTYARALKLSREIGAEEELCQVLWFFNEYHGVRAEHREALEISNQMKRVSARTADALMAALANWAQGANQLFLGQFTSARRNLESVIASYDPQRHPELAHRFGHDMGVVCGTWLAWCLWFLGFRDQALRRAHEAIALARRIDHPMSTAHGLLLWRYCSEAEAVRLHAEEAMCLSKEKDLVFYRALSLIFRGQMLTELGQALEGTAKMQEGLALYEATGSRAGHTMLLSMLAEAHGKAGNACEGLKMIDAALEEVEATDERFCEAEIYRIKAELWHLVDPSVSEPEEFLHRALEIARSQKAKTWELRAATSLSRMWLSQKKTEEARALLGKVYGWFTEGLDTSDLEAAKALLDELSRAR